ncbi:unnamed protein product [Brugia pahangi]|uniref:7TM_GPCR_Srx domain-containing protein n=1 Tax=Brugia pahangi TaxID=6280 RepID=A0A0N4SY60_BRUPA|nr:unnamed protein product [Brugia pahangi]
MGGVNCEENVYMLGNYVVAGVSQEKEGTVITDRMSQKGRLAAGPGYSYCPSLLLFLSCCYHHSAFLTAVIINTVAHIFVGVIVGRIPSDSLSSGYPAESHRYE